MWIETTNTDSAGAPVTSRLKPPFLDEPVAFTENGKAQVTAEVGEQLCEHYDSVAPVDADDDSADASEAEDTSEDTDAGDGSEGE